MPTKAQLREFFLPADLTLIRRPFRYAYIFSFFLGLSFLLGDQLQTQGYTDPGFRGKGLLLLKGLLLALPLLLPTYPYFRYLDVRKKPVPAPVTLDPTDLQPAVTNSSPASESRRQGANYLCFLFSWFVLILAWLPAFLAYYPAIMSYDFHRQSGEAIRGFAFFWEHHPLIHTLLIRCFLLLGKSQGSYALGMAMFAVFQLFILSGVIAYSMNVIYRMTHRIWPVVLSLLLFCLVPMFPVLAISITKDILFSAFFLLFLLLFWEIRQLERAMDRQDPTLPPKAGGRRILLLAAWILVGILSVLFRNNAVYALALPLLFWSLGQPLLRKKITCLLLSLVILCGGVGCKNGLRIVLGAIPMTGTIEMTSVPMEQMARVGNRQGEVLTSGERDLLLRYVSEEGWQDYNPAIADTIRSNAPRWNDVTADNLFETFRDWLTLGLHYPNDYLDAFFELTRGYWYLNDVSHARVLGYGDDTGFGLIYTFNACNTSVFEGIENHSLIPGLEKWYAHIVNGNAYENWGIFKYLMRPALYFWGLILMLLSALYLRRKGGAVILGYPLFYQLTLLLGPVVNIRYIHYLCICLPFLMAWTLTKFVLETDISYNKEMSE